ncbi:MAG: TolB family protein [Rhodothermales bacterium]
MRRRTRASDSDDMWTSRWDGTSWSDPINLGEPINTVGGEGQPAFTADGNTMYFTSDRDPSIGVAICRSNLVGNTWSDPELVIKGIVGEPSITADGRYLYFVHVLTDVDGLFDADVWYAERIP